MLNTKTTPLICGVIMSDSQSEGKLGNLVSEELTNGRDMLFRLRS